MQQHSFLTTTIYTSPSKRALDVMGLTGCGARNWCQQFGDWRIYLDTCHVSKSIPPQNQRKRPETYLAIASLNRDLYSFGLVTVGRFLPPPANPRSLIQLSSRLSHV